MTSTTLLKQPRWTPWRIMSVTVCLKGLRIDTASRDKHPIHSCRQQSVLSSGECFPISVVFILPPSLLRCEACGAPRADWQERRSWLLVPEKQWLTCFEMEGEPARFSLSLLEVRRAPRWRREREPAFTNGDCKKPLIHEQMWTCKSYCTCGSQCALTVLMATRQHITFLPLKPQRVLPTLDYPQIFAGISAWHHLRPQNMQTAKQLKLRRSLSMWIYRTYHPE